jgi:anti-sigma B factor antagonist
MLQIKQKKETFHVSLSKTSRINTLIADAIRDELTEIVSLPGRTIIFSMQDVKFIDSNGFEAILAIVKRSREAESTFKICDVSEEVYELIKLMKLNVVFEIFPERHNQAYSEV